MLPTVNKKVAVLMVLALAGLIHAEGQSAPAKETPKELLNLDSNGVALSGYDAVSYLSNNPVKGNPSITVNHGGATYCFASEQNKKAFLGDPAKYLPAYGGWCAYAMASGNKVEIDPMNYKIKDGKILLFYKDWFTDTRAKWNNDEGKLYPAAEQHWAELLKGK